MSRNNYSYRPPFNQRRNPPPAMQIDPKDDWTEQDEQEMVRDLEREAYENDH